VNYLKYYDLERYLFGPVRERFNQEGVIDPIDFYMILIWKSNRSKNYGKDRLFEAAGNFPTAVKKIADAVYQARGTKERFKILLDEPWKFSVALGSAILTVLYPLDFTVCDTRVCHQLHKMMKSPPGAPSFPKTLSASTSRFELVWRQYKTFKKAVEDYTPPELCLRDKDRYLFGKSFYKQALEDAVKPPALHSAIA
jgi:hypothetical protein